jgi:16S rRNA processing protein RimM
MMSDDRLVVVGQIMGAFGVRGEARIRTFTENPGDCFSFGPLLDEAGDVVLTPVRSRPLGDGFAVTARENRNREDWEGMRGRLLHVRRGAMPTLAEDDYYIADLVGCSVRHADGRALGQVIAAHDFGAGDLIEIETPAGQRFMLPFTRSDVPEVDLVRRLLTAAPDESYLPEALQRQAGDGETN